MAQSMSKNLKEEFIMENNNRKIKKKKPTTWKQDLEIGFNQFFSIKKDVKLIISTLILIFNNLIINALLDINQIPILNNINNLFSKIMKLSNEIINFEKVPIISQTLKDNFNHIHLIINILSILIWVLILYKFSKPTNEKAVHKKIEEIRLVNPAGNIPIFIREYKKTIFNIYIMEFYANGTSIEDWEEKIPNFATMFNCRDVGVKEKGNNKILVAYRKKNNIQILPWYDIYLSKKDFELILGQNAFGEQEKLDLNKIPHVLVRWTVQALEKLYYLNSY